MALGAADPNVVARIVGILIAVGVAIQAVETLSTYRLYAPGGLYDWKVIATNNKWMLFGRRGRVLSTVFDYRAFMGLMAAQLLAALALIANPAPRLSAAWIAVLLFVHLLFVLRNQYGLDGSDQMMLLVLAALLAYQLYPTATMATIVFGFLAGQLVLSYLTAGIAKAISPIWRGGDALARILSTSSYGSKTASRLLLDHRALAVAGCWMVIVFECAGPLLLWIHPAFAVGFIVVGTLFHLSIAVLMGLNIFFWSFISTYPATYYCVSRWSLIGT